ncbi:MAG TPA: C40 family peptidase [Gemmatimonadota bacterium]
MQNPRMVVVATVANLRAAPSHKSELVSQLILGEAAEALEATDGWVRAAGVDGYPGWVSAPALAERADGDVDGPSTSRWGLAWTRRDGTAFDGPGPEAAPLRDLVLGARAQAAEEPDGIAYGRGAGAGTPSDGGRGAATARRPVTLPGGGTAWADGAGWASLPDLPRRFPPDPGAALRTALSLIGVPYLWGGASSKAFDCSGFVQRVFRLHGIELPRDAWQQAEVGDPIDAGPAGAGLAPGDLVFFAEGGTRVTHVGIALGGGRFVHASVRRSGVGVDALDPSDPLHAASLASTLAGGRRVAPAARREFSVGAAGSASG